MKKVVFYGITKDELEIYTDILSAMGISALTIGDEQLSNRFKQVLSMTADGGCGHDRFNEAYLMMDGLSHDEIIVMNESFEAAGKPFQGIMVSATAANREWVVADMMHEAAAEAKIMEKMYELQMMIESTNGMDLDLLKKTHAALLKKTLTDSYLLLMKEEYTLAEITAQVNLLKETLKGTERLKRTGE